jgi:hypothetical protein
MTRLGGAELSEFRGLCQSEKRRGTAVYPPSAADFAPSRGSRDRSGTVLPRRTLKRRGFAALHSRISRIAGAAVVDAVKTGLER